MVRFDIITLFPQMFESPLRESLLFKARQRKLIEISIHNLRDFTTDRHRTADDTPYGGGVGMVMKVEPLVKAIEAVRTSQKASRVVLATPQGPLFTQDRAQQLSGFSQIVIVCGRYEGVDERIGSFIDEEISIGDYVLTGGELPALVIIDAVARMIPGVVGDRRSIREDSLADGFLKYPQYTRPAIFRDHPVPPVLLSGDHAAIARWRRKQSLKKTADKRPDLMQTARLTEKDQQLIEQINKEQQMESENERN